MPTAGSFFSGVGLLDYGLTVAGWKHSWLCEIDPWRRELLGLRWPGVRVLSDVRSVGADSVPRVDRRVERSRLSALGDGVQVQLGILAGEYLMAEVKRRAKVAT